MSIRIKTLIIICITFFILMTIIVTVSRIVILRGFSELEKESVELNVHRSIQSISEILSNLNNTAADWALWDDTYKFMTEHNADYITGNLMYETLINLKINFMMFFDLDSHLVEGRHIDLDNEKGTPFPHDLIEKIILLNNFLKQAKNKNGKTGILMIGQMPVFVSFRPILKSDHSGPTRGILVIGKYLNQSQLNRLAEVTQLSLKIYSFNQKQTPANLDEEAVSLLKKDQIVVKTESNNLISGYAAKKELDGNPGFIIKVEIPRAIYLQGLNTWFYSAISLVIAGLVFGILLIFTLEKIVLSPLRILSSKVAEIGKKKYDVSNYLPIERKDELGALAEKINQMLKQIADNTILLEKINSELLNDIEKRKQIEKDLKESEERYKSILEAVPNVIAITGNNGRFKEVNEVFISISGFSYEEVNGKTPTELNLFVNFEDRENISRLLRANGIVNGIDIKFRAKDGRIMDVILSMRPMRYKNEECYIWSISDITEQKRIEREKKKLEIQLQRAQKMEAIGTLASGVAHDLNNILSGIVSYPELLLLELPEDSPLRRPIQTIQKSGQRAANIVSDMLTLARRGYTNFEPLNLNDIIGEFLNSLEYERIKAKHKAISIKTKPDKNLSNIIGSPLHLLKVIMNLVSNSAEALPDGGTIEISTENRYIEVPTGNFEHIQKGDYATLTIADNGIGIAPEYIERIFEPFYTKKVMGIKGTGLGMAVVWGTVKDHNGYIDVKSTEGEGTVFTLYFQKTQNEAPQQKAPVAIENYMGLGESVLIVDDVNEQREIASRMLKKLGYNVSSVSSGEEAIEFIKDKYMDLAMLDMIMEPGIDGLETYKRMLAVRPNQKAIIVSGYSESDRVIEAQKLGAGQYIRKPYTLEKIGIAVKKELGYRL